MNAYRLTPSKSGWYVFFSSGYMKNIRATLYEGDGENGGLRRVTYDYDNDGKCGFSAELTEGTTYTLLIEGYVKKTDTIFDIGFFNKESTLLMASASEIVLTDPNCSYNFGVCSGSEFAESSYWVIQDDSIAGSDGSSTFSRGTTEYPSYYNGMTIKLNARKNGTTTVSLINGATKEAYASCKVICKDIPENDGSDDQDGGEAPEETDEPEYSTDNPGFFINPEKEEYNAQKGQVVTIKFDMSCDAEALGSGFRFLYYADYVPKSSQNIIKYKALGPYEFIESNGKLVADGYIEYDCLTEGTGQLYVYMLVNGTRYDKHVITINVSDPSSDKGEDNKPDDSSGQNQGGQTPDNQQGDDPKDGDQQKPEGNTPSSDPSKQTGTDGTALGKGAAFEAAEAAISGMKSDSDLPGAVFRKLQLKSTKQTKNKITLSWKKIAGAKTYIIYGNQCGSNNKMKLLAKSGGKTKTFKKILGKKLRKGKYYKFMIVAVDKYNKVVSSSKIIHVATKGGKVGNIGKVTTKAKKNKAAIKKGKTFKLGAKQVAAVKKLKVKKHRALSYESSNPKIATVSKKGVIKGKKKGTCYVYAYAQNGVFAKIKVTVR
ncbi:MAG: Ig-like domain-containing protein [Mogibacterium sp.]|nr:Ig-like domain-containing protein [Mogibacterium sp.]MBR0343552.1 Ig-like domain-containing protein [Oscillospiraceae bacterium]